MSICSHFPIIVVEVREASQRFTPKDLAACSSPSSS
jgi:hypothetical protein